MSARVCVLLAASLFVFGIVVPVQAVAAPIADFRYVETALAGGHYQYDYTLFNDGDPAGDAGYDIYDVAIFFSSGAFISGSVPIDWDVIGGGGFVASFSLAPGAPPTGADVGPGMTLAGFSFVIDQQVGAVPFEVLFTNPVDPFDPILFEGVTSAATLVPEPSSMLLLASGIGALFAARRRSGHSPRQSE